MRASLIIVFAGSYGIMAALMGATIWQIVHDKPYGVLLVISIAWIAMLPTASGKVER